MLFLQKLQSLVLFLFSRKYELRVSIIDYRIRLGNLSEMKNLMRDGSAVSEVNIFNGFTALFEIGTICRYLFIFAKLVAYFVYHLFSINC